MSEMSSLRKEDLSLYAYIKEYVLRNFIEFDDNMQLALIPDLCSTNSYVYETITSTTPSPIERGRGWVYFDLPQNGIVCEPYVDLVGLNGDGKDSYGVPEQSNRVIVYEQIVTVSGVVSVVVPWTEYMIDYIDGRIITERKLTNPTVSYYWNYISLVDEWAAIQAADPPVVVLDMYGTDKIGYQLGGGKKSTRRIDIHIFATNPAERNDLVETLYNGFFNRSCTFFDFPTGAALDYDGTFYGRKDIENRYPGYVFPTEYQSNNKLTYLFDRTRVENVSKLMFDNVTSRNVSLPLIMTRGRDEVMLSDLNAYRAKVSFDLVCYDDRTIG